MQAQVGDRGLERSDGRRRHARHEQPLSPLEYGGGGRHGLLRRLALREHDLRQRVAEGAMVVNSRKVAEILIGEIAQPLDGLRDREAGVLHILEQGSQPCLVDGGYPR